MAEDAVEIGNAEMCFPCSLSKKDTEAKTFCCDCKENLCDSCTKIHSTRNATKSHKPVPIEQKMEYVKMCDPCEYDYKQNIAIEYCKECNEYLCSHCVKAHKKRKATNKHILADVESLNDSHSQSGAVKYCDICSATATDYCELCTELLCDNCASIHKLQNATKSHKPIPIKDMPDLLSGTQSDSDRSCEPCGNSGKTISAVKYCRVCDECLCGECGSRHAQQKITRSHELKDVSEADTKSQLCSFCLQINKKSTSAVSFCKECKEAFCSFCVQYHKTQKATQDHMLVSVSEMTTSTTNANGNICDKCQTQTTGHYCTNCTLHLCDKCVYKHTISKPDHNIKESPIFANAPTCEECNVGSVTAVNHCVKCKTYLCDKCTTLHKLQKMAKSHIIISVDALQKSDSEHCDRCIEMGEKITAVKYCMECEEYLCKNCCDYHPKNKQSMNHELKNIAQFKRENKLDCGPCMYSDKDSPADSFCKECEEFLCSGCKNRHKAAKLSRNHTFLSVYEGRSLSIANAHLCDPCKYNHKSNKAFAFCQLCQELLCDLCLKQHMAQKATREHQILKDLSKYKPEASDEIVPEIKIGTEGMASSNQSELSEEEQRKKDIPGKPILSSVKADSVTLVWDKPNVFDGQYDYYQVSFREVSREKWTFVQGEYDVANVNVTSLKANTDYVFRVRVVHSNSEGQYSEESDVIHTIVSPAAKLVDLATVVVQGRPSPSVYGVPIEEIKDARNAENKTRKFEVGKKRTYQTDEKTIMLVGATGTGKSTLVDGFLNYTLGVNWSDKFRFTVIDLEAEEKARLSNQALSQTEWITVYAVNPEAGSRINYRLNIIDTPGFGDTRGLDRDEQIVNQIRALFSASGAKGVVCIDAICFLIKAPDARLTAVQKYIFQSIMAIFGKDVEKNICSLITFADCQHPPVLAALKESNLPFGDYFPFNNSGLFAKNADLESVRLSPMFWDMGMKCFDAFFTHMETMETKSLQLTKDVLEERRKLELTVQNLQPQVDAGLSKLNMMIEEVRIIEQHKLDADANRDFEYEVEETQQKKHDLPKGKHTTNCIHCNFTCHKSCAYSDNDDKRKCSAMGRDGNCKQCPDKCNWERHANTPYIFEYITVKKKMTYEEKLQKYQDAEGKRLTHEQVIARMSQECADLQDAIEELMATVKMSNERLGEIALRPHPVYGRPYRFDD